MKNKLYDENNVFARIIRGELPCKKVYEDNYVLAFDDISPVSPVHVLIVPKSFSYISFQDFASNASLDEMKAWFEALNKVAEIKGLAESGFRLVTNVGESAGQTVPHFHVHLLGGKNLGGLLDSNTF